MPSQIEYAPVERPKLSGLSLLVDIAFQRRGWLPLDLASFAGRDERFVLRDLSEPVRRGWNRDIVPLHVVLPAFALAYQKPFARGEIQTFIYDFYEDGLGNPKKLFRHVGDLTCTGSETAPLSVNIYNAKNFIAADPDRTLGSVVVVGDTGGFIPPQRSVPRNRNLGRLANMRTP